MKILELINEKQNTVQANEKRLSPRTVRYIYTTIHKALSDAQEMQPPLVEFNAAEGIKKKLPKLTKNEMKTMSAQQIGIFLNTLKNQKLNHHHYSPFFAAFYLELHTGLRRGELLGLQWQDIDFEKRELKVVRQLIRGKKGLYFKDPKTESSKRTIRLDERVMNILKEHQDAQKVVKLDGTGLVFCLENGEPVDPDNFTRHYQFILDKAGLGHFRFHDLRHSFVTLGLKNKIDYKTLMKFTGHASSKTFFDVYSHSDTEMQDEAAQVFGDLIDGCNKGIAETK
jgi:integrase